MMRVLRRVALWLVWNVPMGRLAPWMLGFALNSWPEIVDDKERE